MLLEEERKQVVRYCQMIVEKKLTRGTGGNISIYNKHENLVAISPSGIDYKVMKPEDVVIITLDMKIIEGTKKPSSEKAMHIILLRERDDMRSIIHTHSPYASAYSCLRTTLPAVHYLVALGGGTNVRCAEYASYGTAELAQNAYAAMVERKVCLLANHGLLAGGSTIAEAFNIAEEIEFMCEIYMKVRPIGNPLLLDDTEMNFMREKFKTYEQQKS